MGRITLSETRALSFETVDCYKCGVTFAMTVTYTAERRRDHENWYCPNGHGQRWAGESQEEKLARELKETRERAGTAIASWREQFAHERASHTATKGKLTKTLKRVENGVCPHCNRTFVNLARHIARHGDATPEQVHARNEHEKGTPS